MTAEELNTANEAYALLTALQGFYAQVSANPTASVPDNISTSLPNLAADMQSGELTVVQTAIDNAQTVLDGL